MFHISFRISDCKLACWFELSVMVNWISASQEPWHCRHRCSIVSLIRRRRLFCPVEWLMKRQRDLVPAGFLTLFLSFTGTRCENVLAENSRKGRRCTLFWSPAELPFIEILALKLNCSTDVNPRRRGSPVQQKSCSR